MIALDLHFSTFLLLYGFITLIEYIMWKRRSRNISFMGIAIVTLYILLVVKVALCPMIYLKEENRQEFMMHVGEYVCYYQFIPFKTILNTFQTNAWVLQIFGNILLLFPVPLLYGLVAKKMPHMKTLIMMGTSISVMIEVIQLMIDMVGAYPSHIADVDDIILNSIGVAMSAGILCFIQGKHFFMKVKQRFRKESSS